jgi:hypothetical protein
LSRLPTLLKLHAADPGDGELCYMIALEHTKIPDDQQAIAWLDKGIAANPSHHYAYYQKAKAQMRLDQHNEALVTVDFGLRQARKDGNQKAVGELSELKGELE